MAVATAPYTTSAAVAIMMNVPLKGGTDFANDGTTVPTKTAVETMIGWISSQIDLQFSMAGYILPFAALTDESWPTTQTTYLQLIATLGTAAMAGGYSQKPLPAVSPGRTGGTGNVLQDLYLAELKKIFDPQFNRTSLNFRSTYRIGTPAQIALTDPRGPTTDFLEGHYDPYRQLDNWDIAQNILDIERGMRDMSISWDYLYRVLNRGFGSSSYEEWHAFYRS